MFWTLFNLIIYGRKSWVLIVDYILGFIIKISVKPIATERYPQMLPPDLRRFELYPPDFMHLEWNPKFFPPQISAKPIATPQI
mgnify:CR=1 FL=1